MKRRLTTREAKARCMEKLFILTLLVFVIILLLMR